MSYSNDLRRELDDYLEEHSIAELLEMVADAVRCREYELAELKDNSETD